MCFLPLSLAPQFLGSGHDHNTHSQSSCHRNTSTCMQPRRRSSSTTLCKTEGTTFQEHLQPTSTHSRANPHPHCTVHSPSSTSIPNQSPSWTSASAFTSELTHTALRNARAESPPSPCHQCTPAIEPESEVFWSSSVLDLDHIATASTSTSTYTTQTLPPHSSLYRTDLRHLPPLRQSSLPFPALYINTTYPHSTSIQTSEKPPEKLPANATTITTTLDTPPVTEVLLPPCSLSADCLPLSHSSTDKPLPGKRLYPTNSTSPEFGRNRHASSMSSCMCIGRGCGTGHSRSPSPSRAGAPRREINTNSAAELCLHTPCVKQGWFKATFGRFRKLHQKNGPQSTQKLTVSFF